MNETRFSDYLGLLEPYLPKGLISENSFHNILKLTSNFPGTLAFSTFGFECSLTHPGPEADFLFSLRTNNQGPEILAGQLPEVDFDHQLMQIEQWEQARVFGQKWADQSAELYQGIDDVWLEFDLSGQAAKPDYAPSLFFSPGYRYHLAGNKSITLDNCLNLINDVFSLIKGRKPEDSAIANWERCLSFIPMSKQVFQVGMMLARDSSDYMRTCIVIADKDELLRYLKQINWRGHFDSLIPVLNKLSTLFKPFYLHLDVGPDISEKIGIECKFPQRRGPDREPNWAIFLDFLEENKLCLPEKRSALLSFPGYEKTDINTCPEPLRKTVEQQSPFYSSFWVRNIYHTKLVFKEDYFQEAKAYLGINHLWQSLASGEENKYGPGDWGIIA